MIYVIRIAICQSIRMVLFANWDNGGEGEGVEEEEKVSDGLETGEFGSLYCWEISLNMRW